METKTYKAESMLEALQMVQAELGPDAIVLSAREAAGAGWAGKKRPGVEVVAMASGPAAKSLNNFMEKLQASQAAKGASAGSGSTTAAPAREEVPQIEWVTGPEPRRNPIPVYPPAQKTSSAKTEARPASQPAAWQPQRMDVPALGGRDAEPKPIEPKTNEAKPAVKSADIPAAMKKVRQILLDQGLDEALVDRIFKVAREMFSSGALQDEDVCRKYISKLLEADLKELGSQTFTQGRRVVCLVGASGSGKTSTIAKLALFYSQKLGRKVTWVCADTLRTGAISEARAYADALGIPLSLAYTPEDLRAILADHSASDLILIDTSGYNPFREEQMVELGSLLSELRGEGMRPATSIYLTAPANVKESDLSRASAALGIFGLDGVIFTRLDETATYGSVYNFARKSQLALGYFTSGRGADSSLQAASAARLVTALLGKGWVK